MTKTDLRRAIARRLEDLVAYGVVLASPAPTTVSFAADAFRPYTVTNDPALMRRRVAMIDGTQAGKSSIVTAYVTSTYQITFVIPFASAPAAGDKFDLYNNLLWEDYNEAIEYAEKAARRHFLLPKDDRTVVLATSTFEYTLPAGFIYVSEIIREGTTGIFNQDIPRRWWTIEDVGGTAKLIIVTESTIGFSGKKLKIVGQKYPTVLTTETTVVDSHEEFMVNFAAWWLGLSKPLESADPEGWRQRVAVWKGRSDELMRLEGRKPWVDALRVPGR